MNPLLIETVLETIAASTGSQSSVDSFKTVSGGCISSSNRIKLADGRSMFVKSSSDWPEIFEREADSLIAIEATNTLRVPDVIGHGITSAGEAFIVLEPIDTGNQKTNFFAEFGRQLANMHKTGSSVQFGFESHNFIGSTPQVNTWTENWSEFWATNRLEFQVLLAEQNGHGSPEMFRKARILIDRIETILGVQPVQPCLLHGDLWSGNFMCDSMGSPVLIDPAAYYGSREVEFGMTTLFGGFETDFYHAYNEAWPFEDGWQERVEVYRLYHLLNHLNLFGNQYLNDCMEIFDKFAG